MLREIELVHRARQCQEAVRVEDLRETLRLVLEIGLDLERGVGRRPARRAPATRRRPKRCVELARAAVGDRAELAREAQPRARPATGLVRRRCATPGRCARSRAAASAARSPEPMRWSRPRSRSARRPRRDTGRSTPAPSCRRATARRRRPRARCRARAAPRAPALAMSSTESSRKRRAVRPAGRADRSRRGLDEPNGLPSELTQTTCQRRVSMGRASPIIDSHQPGVGSAAEDAACADGDSPVKSSTVLSSAAIAATPALVGDDRLRDRPAAIQPQRLRQAAPASARGTPAARAAA